jgi:hypothetical protein
MAVTAGRNRGLVLRVNGHPRIRVTRLAGATTTAQRSLRLGILRYETKAPAAVRVYHSMVHVQRVAAASWPKQSPLSS